MIPQQFIQELLSRIDVVDVVGRSVQLKKAGANYQGLCPFHSEKSPSFSVSPTKQFYHCFGCGAHGSAVGFLMEHQGLSYVDAIKDLASSVGLTVPEEKSSNRANEKAAPDLLELLSQAERFYRHRLKESDRAISYFKGRGLSGQTAARFGLGYAPDAWRGLEAAVTDYRNPDLIKAGLVIQSDDEPDKRWDRFRDRVMFPIRNPRGQTIGFGGRILDQGEPKYLNSPETPVFSKGRELYGLYEGRDALRKENTAIVVEGYMDVVMLAEHGIGNAVATLGTATTPDHVRKLTRLVDRIVFSFDGDRAGRKAAWRALEACLPQLSDTKRIDFLFLPPEHDPDTYVKENGEQAFRQLLDSATSFSNFLIGTLEDRCDIDTAEGRAQFLAQARPLLQQIPEIAFKLQLQRQVSQKSAVSDAEMQKFLSVKQEQRGESSGSNLSSTLGSDPSNNKPYTNGNPKFNPDSRGRFGKPDRLAVGAIRSKAGPVALERQIHLLTLFHPSIARQFLVDQLSGDGVGTGNTGSHVLRWLRAVADCGDGSFASLCDQLREEFPNEIDVAQSAAALDKANLAELSSTEALQELLGGFRKLQERALRAEQLTITQRMGSGEIGAELQARYRELNAQLAELSRAADADAPRQ